MKIHLIRGLGDIGPRERGREKFSGWGNRFKIFNEEFPTEFENKVACYVEKVKTKGWILKQAKQATKIEKKRKTYINFTLPRRVERGEGEKVNAEQNDFINGLLKMKW